MITRLLATAAAAALLTFVTATPSRAQTAAPTFSKDIAPIFYANCTDCHRPGEIAPMSLLTFKDARPWARSIATRVKERRRCRRGTPTRRSAISRTRGG